MTTAIQEKVTRRIIDIEGDIVSAMKACVTRNNTLRREGIGGKWRLYMSFHLSPSEYENAIKVIENR